MACRLRVAVALAAALSLSAPAAAGAAVLTNAGGTLAYTAEPGGVNVVTLAGGPTVLVTRGAGDTDALTTVSGCDPVTGQQYACGGVARVVVVAGAGNDSVDASDLVVPIDIRGGDGADALTGGAAGDTVSGGPGDDTLDGGAGADRVSGGNDNDAVTGGNDNDVVYGNDGEDVLVGGFGADVVSGGPGIDRAQFAVRPSVAVSLDGAPNDGAPSEGDNVLDDVEDVTVKAEASGTATVIGNAAGNALDVDGGRGTIVGAAGADTLLGGPQDDTIDARDGYPDRVICNEGNDTALVDTVDTVSPSCENAPVSVVPGGADDRPPTVAWTAPAAAASFRGSRKVTLAVNATDDRGVAKVQFYDDDRLVCDDTTAPYTCEYQARGSDVGRNALIATAVDGAAQTATAVRRVTINRFRPRSLSLSVVPRRDRTAPYRFRARGRLASALCAGTVTVTVKAGGRTVSPRRAKVTRTCRYGVTLTFRSRPASTLTFSARLGSSATTLARSSPRRIARLS